MSAPQPLVIGIFGPTACRKSEFALEAAERWGGEIINCDSVQVYSRVQIGANKPSSEELKRVPHHLFGFVEPPNVYTAGQFHRDFHHLITERAAKGVRLFFLVGGSGFYARAALKGLYPVEASRPERRDALTKEWERDQGVTLFEELTARDPDYAAHIGPKDQKRVIRALEILRHSNFKTLQELEDNLKSQPKNFRILQMAFFREREDLRKRILERAEGMLKRGLMEEVKALLSEGLESWAPMKSVGYLEVVQALRGELEMEKLPLAISQNTARLAKRQMTWLRSEEGIHWFHADQDWEKALALVEKSI